MITISVATKGWETGQMPEVAIILSPRKYDLVAALITIFHRSNHVKIRSKMMHLNQTMFNPATLLLTENLL